MDPRGTGAPIGPRVVVVTRPSELELLIAHHGTKEQARFVLRQRGQELGPVEAAHRALDEAARTVLGALPLSYRRARVGRQDLPRFLFEPADVIVAVGQDGLVANVAKYLDGQPVIAVCPSTPGVLARTGAAAFADQLADVLAARARIEERTMVEARLDDGQVLRSLNEIFVGHRSHQSARYELWSPDAARHERQSSSGVVFASGTGATGWAASIARQSREAPALPQPTEPHLVYLVREAWPSPSTGTSLVAGAVQATERVALVSEMNEGGVVFGDGMESDRLTLGWGQRVEVGPSTRRLRLAA
jgi:NAD kinase